MKATNFRTHFFIPVISPLKTPYEVVYKQPRAYKRDVTVFGSVQKTLYNLIFTMIALLLFPDKSRNQRLNEFQVMTPKSLGNFIGAPNLTLGMVGRLCSHQ